MSGATSTARSDSRRRCRRSAIACFELLRLAAAAFVQQIHVITPPRLVEPMFEAPSQRREIGHHERDAERQHPEAEDRQKSEEPERAKNDTAQRSAHREAATVVTNATHDR